MVATQKSYRFAFYYFQKWRLLEDKKAHVTIEDNFWITNDTLHAKEQKHVSPQKE